jgi:anti-sigma B factor antagonist
VPENEPTAGTDGFRVAILRSGATARLVLAGELDLLTAPELQSAIDQVLSERARHVVLDLRELDFLDSTAITIIYRLDQLARQDGFNLAVVRGKANLQRVFAITGLDNQLVFVDAPEELAPPGDDAPV